MLILAATPAFAQDLPAPFCGDLNEADCAILTDSHAAQMEVSAYSSSVDAVTTVAGLPGLPANELVFDWAQDTTIDVDMNVAMKMLEMQMDPQAMVDNMDDFMALAVEFYQTVGLDTMVNFAMPTEIADALSAQSGIDVPTEIALHVILKDGFAYISTDGLDFIDPSIPAMGDWLGVDFAGLLEMSMQQGLADADPQQQQAMMTSMGLSAMLTSSDVRDLLDPFVSVERLDDDTVDGVDVAVFSDSFDFAGFLASPAFWGFVEANLDTINSLSETPVTADELQQAQMALTFLGPALLQGLELTSVKGIGLDDLYPYGQTVDFHWDLASLLSFAASTGAVPAEMATSDALVSLVVDATNTDFNDITPIEAPADAMIFPIDGGMSQ
jgi:hypothetical protein